MAQLDGMTNRVQFLICVFVLMAGSVLATGTNDTIMPDSSTGNTVKDIAEAQVDPAVYDSLVGRYDYGIEPQNDRAIGKIY